MYLYFLLFLSSCVGISNYYYQVKIESAEHKKMYNIIMNKGSIDKDLYKRTISEDVVKIFCKIAKKFLRK